jgi:hypothetical protein
MKLTRLSICSGLAHLACAGDPVDTDVTDQLNGFIEMSDSAKNGWYSAGKGIIVRAPDFISSGDEKVVPASFWSNDISSPSQFYPSSGNVWFPNNGWDGYGDISFQTPDPPAGDAGPWTFASVGVVIGTSMSTLYDHFDDIQNSDWGWGVFYATDSNSVDQRCIYWDDNNGWDCPGGWLDSSGNFDTSTGSKGAGNYYMGNPDAYGFDHGGGGTGCHFSSGYNTIDQPDSSDPNRNLVSNANCECNYDLNGNEWMDWVDAVINNLQQKDAFKDSRPWLGGTGNLAPSWAMDATMCWVSNPRDLIMLQNQLHWNRNMWNNHNVPSADWDSGQSAEMRKYWGWNEVPVDRSIVEDPQHWDAVMIKLPADVCNNNFGEGDNVWCLGDAEKIDLENQLDQFVQQKRLLPGAENIAKRPGSYVVFAREWGSPFGSSVASSHNHTREVGASFSGMHWQRYFYCEDWVSPGNKYKIVPMKKSDDPNGNGACYIDYANGPPTPSPSPSPTPPSPGPMNQNAIVHVPSNKCLGVSANDVSNGKALVVSDCDGQDSQGWWFDEQQGTLTSTKNSQMCVDIPNGDMSSGNGLQVWECNGSPQQWFGHDDAANNIFASNSADADLCVDVQNGGSNQENNVWLWNCNGGDNQKFNVDRAHGATVLA